MVHDLPTDAKSFDAIARGAKTHELLEDPHGRYDVLDVLRLQEIESVTVEFSMPSIKLTGREVALRVTHLEKDQMGLSSGMVIASGVIVVQDEKPLGDLSNYDLNTFINAKDAKTDPT